MIFCYWTLNTRYLPLGGEPRGTTSKLRRLYQTPWQAVIESLFLSSDSESRLSTPQTWRRPRNACLWNCRWFRSSSRFTEQFVMSYPALSRECLSSCWAEHSCVIQTAPPAGSGGGWGCAERGYFKAACGVRGLLLELWNVGLNCNKKHLQGQFFSPGELSQAVSKKFNPSLPPFVSIWNSWYCYLHISKSKCYRFEMFSFSLLPGNRSWWLQHNLASKQSAIMFLFSHLCFTFFLCTDSKALAKETKGRQGEVFGW